jgi:hypothetical protein
VLWLFRPAYKTTGHSRFLDCLQVSLQKGSAKQQLYGILLFFLGCDAASLGDWYLRFRDNIVVFCNRIDKFKKNYTLLPSNTRRKSRLETLDTNLPITRRHISEKRRPHLHGCKSFNLENVWLFPWLIPKKIFDTYIFFLSWLRIWKFVTAQAALSSNPSFARALFATDFHESNDDVFSD